MLTGRTALLLPSGSRASAFPLPKSAHPPAWICRKMGAYRSVLAGGVYGYTRLLDEQDLPVGGQWPVVMRDGALEAVRVVPHLDHRRPHIVVDVAGLVDHGIAALLLILDRKSVG